MRRDHFTLTARDVDDEDAEPTLVIEYNGPEETLTSQLTEGGTVLAAGDIDAAFRLKEPMDSDGATGVFSLTHRVTGEYLLEANGPASEVLDLVDAARNGAEEDADYRIDIERESGEPISYELDRLLVYDANGGLLRQHSLIPSGVEL
ncbi:MAG: DUF5793 family protein [Halovenus sp.]